MIYTPENKFCLITTTRKRKYFLRTRLLLLNQNRISANCVKFIDSYINIK
jgi:hypothetical protein